MHNKLTYSLVIAYLLTDVGKKPVRWRDQAQNHAKHAKNI